MCAAAPPETRPNISVNTKSVERWGRFHGSTPWTIVAVAAEDFSGMYQDRSTDAVTGCSVQAGFNLKT